MREMLYAEWVCVRMAMMDMMVRLSVLAIFGLMLGGTIMLCLVVIMTSVLVPRILCASSLSEGWEAYDMTFPAGRQKAVASRFLLTLVCNIMAAILCMAGMVVCWTVTGTTERSARDIALLLACVAWAMGMSGILLASAYRWSMERANYMLNGGIAVLYLGIAVVKRVGTLHHIWQVWSLQLTEKLNGREILVALLLACIGWFIYGLCYVLSVRIYQKKEL